MMSSSMKTPFRENAEEVLPVHVSTPQDMAHVVVTLCPDLFPRLNSNKDETAPWDGFHEKKEDAQVTASSPGRCNVRPLSGGLSNELFIVSSREKESNSVLVRIHPPSQEGQDDIVNREVENRVMAFLSKEGIAPTFYGRFLNGRVEEFYTNYRPLSCQEMPQYASQVAFRLAQLHQLTVPDGVLAINAVDSSDFGDYCAQVESWLQLAHRQQELHKRELLEGKDSVLYLDTLENELQWLKQQLSSSKVDADSSSTASRAATFCREIVFTHMDCQCLNVLLSEKTNDLKVIDFEYAGRNARAADIANTFCEFCDMNKLKADFATQYPSIALQNEFIEAYMNVIRPEWVLELKDTDCWGEFLSGMRHEIGRHTLLSHLGWAVWSIVQSEKSAIDFDYIAYAKLRMEGYNYFRSKYFDI